MFITSLTAEQLKFDDNDVYRCFHIWDYHFIWTIKICNNSVTTQHVYVNLDSSQSVCLCLM